MKIAFLGILLMIWPGDINKIAYINRLKKEAEKHYEEKKYSEAASKYQILADSLGQTDDEILMNLSHCYFNMNDTSNAYFHYKGLCGSGDPRYRSVAYQQLGILNTQAGRYDEAEEDFKNSLRTNPANGDARFNYELLKKRMRDEQNKDQPPQDQNKDQQQQDQKSSEKQDEKSQDQPGQDQKQEQQQKQDQPKEGQQQEQQDQSAGQDQQNKPKEENQQDQNLDQNQVQKISEEKARMILEAMKNAEEQYLQQRQRKSTKKPDSGKPDW